MAINISRGAPKRVAFGLVRGKIPKIGDGGNTGPAPKILKSHKFPKIRGIK